MATIHAACMPYTVTYRDYLYKKTAVQCESLGVTTEKQGFGCFSRSPQVVPRATWYQLKID